MEVSNGESKAINDNEVEKMQVEEEAVDISDPGITLIAKYGKQKFVLDDLIKDTTILEVKLMLQEKTRILPKRQKLVGLTAKEGGAKGVHDDLQIDFLKAKGKSKGDDGQVTHQFILMGTPEDDIFVDPKDNPNIPDIIDDWDLDLIGTPDSKDTLRLLRNFTEKTKVDIMNEPREGFPLLVLDLDHTLLDFSSKALQRDGASAPGQGMAAAMKRPFMDQFLTACYEHYDLVVWSQTSWRWLETKLVELGMLTHPGYKFCFVLDKTSMFKVTSTKRDGTTADHHVKALELIWRKFPRWNIRNTAHVDDLARNFALNPLSGIKIKAYYRKKASAHRDADLLGLARYLADLAKSKANFEEVDFDIWIDVVAGKSPMLSNKKQGDPQSKG